MFTPKVGVGAVSHSHCAALARPRTAIVLNPAKRCWVAAVPASSGDPSSLASFPATPPPASS